MKAYFTDTKDEDSYVILVLPEKVFRYCKTPDEKLYVKHSLDGVPRENAVIELISELHSFILTKRDVAILNLLVNPYFDELCEYMRTASDISKGKRKKIRKHIFEYLASPKANRIHSDPYIGPYIAGTEIYKSKRMFERSKEILESYK